MVVNNNVMLICEYPRPLPYRVLCNYIDSGNCPTWKVANTCIVSFLFFDILFTLI